MTAAVSIRSVSQRYGAALALDQVSLDISAGEIHCLLGENGAGKSTLMNVLYGIYQPDSGEIAIDGRSQQYANPKQAMAAGIGMVIVLAGSRASWITYGLVLLLSGWRLLGWKRLAGVFAFRIGIGHGALLFSLTKGAGAVAVPLEPARPDPI